MRLREVLQNLAVHQPTMPPIGDETRLLLKLAAALGRGCEGPEGPKRKLEHFEERIVPECHCQFAVLCQRAPLRWLVHLCHEQVQDL